METFDFLYALNLFPIKIADYLSSSLASWVIYSPLARRMILMDEKEFQSLRKEIETSGRFSQEELQKELIDNQIVPEFNYVDSPHDVFALTILPNNICNFSCSYCYAAKGHGHDELDIQTLRTVLDFFINRKRIKRQHLYISFGGGGEPLLSWEKVKFVLQYADELAISQDFIIHYSFASNGSIINDDMIDSIKKYHIKTNISFDILEDIQNVQRKHYNKVCKTLDLLLEHDIYPTINSVITPLNVGRQEEMVMEIYRRFPKLKRLSFDYVVDAKLYDTVDGLQAFYDEYTQHFFSAQKIGEDLGITVSSIKYHNLEQIKMRACVGGFDLTPHGTLSMCFFVSSSKEPLYSDFIYGKITDNKIEFDEKKFQQLVKSSDNKQEKCHCCFLKWHCAGGCLYHKKSYSKEMLDVMCRFQQKFSLIALVNKVTKQNILEYGSAESQ